MPKTDHQPTLYASLADAAVDSTAASEAFRLISADGVVLLTLRPGESPCVEVAPELATDAAARHFWNAVCVVAGMPAMFPDA